MKKAAIVIGLGYGDEGKGVSTNYLCSRHLDPLVIRFNGGQQAGHTVLDATGRRHVFSNFGAGSLNGVPTYWSRFCTLSPGSLLNELQALKDKNCSPLLYIDNQCYVTTHYDILCNRVLEMSRGNARHGSCGMGFGVTIERNEVAGISLLAADLKSRSVLRQKLTQIRDYYRDKLQPLNVVDFDSLNHDEEDERFSHSIDMLLNLPNNVCITDGASLIQPDSPFDAFVFEGAQGIMLDMDFGTFPHVTRSNTCSKNALQLIREFYPSLMAQTEIYYISRTYQTRHGAGPMSNTDLIPELQNTEDETNVYNEHQGNFRISALDLDQIQYALQCEMQHSAEVKKNLIVTCLDQLKDNTVLFTIGGRAYTTSVEEMIFNISENFSTVLISNSACGSGMMELKFRISSNLV